MQSNNTAVQVVPDPNGDTTITIKLIIAVAPATEETSGPEPPTEATTPHSAALLGSDSDDSTSVGGNGNDTRPPRPVTRQSLRGRIQVEQEEDSDY